MNQIANLELVNPHTIRPISDIYQPARLQRAIELLQQSPQDMAVGIIVQREDDYVEIAGRYRNLSATFQTIDLKPSSALIPVYVVTSLEQAQASYRKLLSQETGPLNKILESIETRWANLDERVLKMQDFGYNSLIDVARKSTVLNYRSTRPLLSTEKSANIVEEALF